MSEKGSRLNDFFKELNENTGKKEKMEKEMYSEINKYIVDIIKPAFEEIRQDLEKNDREVSIFSREDRATIEINHRSSFEYKYEIRFTNLHPYPVTTSYDPHENSKLEGHGYFRSGEQNYTIHDVTKEEIVTHFIDRYTDHLRYLERFK